VQLHSSGRRIGQAPWGPPRFALSHEAASRDEEVQIVAVPLARVRGIDLRDGAQNPHSAGF
jgi:hypothetical protein